MSKKFLDKKLDKVIRWLRFHQVVDRVPMQSVVCDIGCGHDCLFLNAIDNRLTKGIGIDRSVDHFIENKNEKIKVYQADVQERLPLEEESVDVVTMMALIEHLDRPQEALGEIYRILRSGGRLILTTPTPASRPLLEFMAFKLKIIDRKEIEDHKRYFSAKVLQESLREAGFKDIKTKHFELGLNLLGIATK